MPIRWCPAVGAQPARRTEPPCAAAAVLGGLLSEADLEGHDPVVDGLGQRRDGLDATGHNKGAGRRAPAAA